MTEIGGATTLVGLLGWPVSHSLSPRMHNAAFAALGLEWAYVPLPTPPERLAAAVAGIAAAGFRGANVTIPHKQTVVPLADELDDVARRAGSANTLVFEERRVLASSTDGAAVADQVDASGRRCLVLGAGGAAVAVAQALRDGSAAEVAVSSRRDPGWPPSAAGYDVLVNATPVKDDVIVPPVAGQQVVDLAYNADGSETALVAAARRAGCTHVVDGLDVLVAQGAASFERWTGRSAPIEVMRDALRSRP